MTKLLQAAPVRAVLRLRLLVVAVAASAIAIVDQGETPFDTYNFIVASRVLASGEWLDTFADPQVQIGPLQLAVYRVLAAAADLLHVDYTVVFGPVTEIAIAVLVVLAVRRLRVGLGLRASAPAELGAGLLAVAWDLPSSAYLYGHPGQVVIPVMWIFAGLDARSGRWARAGVLVGTAAGIETWGVLGLPVLLLAPRVPDVVRAVATAGLLAMCWYLPFAAFGDFRMDDYRWVSTSYAPLARWIGPYTPTGWELRAVQATSALVAGAGAAVSMRCRRDAVWAVPTAVLLIRLVLDPVNHSYYWVAPQVAFLLVAASMARTADPARWFALVCLYPVTLVESVNNVVVVVIGLIGLTVLSGSRSRHRAAS